MSLPQLFWSSVSILETVVLNSLLGKLYIHIFAVGYWKIFFPGVMCSLPHYLKFKYLSLHLK